MNTKNLSELTLQELSELKAAISAEIASRVETIPGDYDPFTHMFSYFLPIAGERFSVGQAVENKEKNRWEMKATDRDGRVYLVVCRFGEPEFDID